ncbi:MAG: 16S rRNA (uracil(1498)-N(3))-methyltransferase [Pseudomonadota bacterium]
MHDFKAPRLFVADDLPGDIALDTGQANYVRNVMRLGDGARMRVFNGRDGEFIAAVRLAGKRSVTLDAHEAVRPQPAPLTLWYAFAPLRQARLDYMVEKAVEMGAGRLVPVLTQHGQVRRINAERMRKNVIEACEQCGVLAVPEIAEPQPFGAFLASLGERRLIVADEALAGEETDPIAAIKAAAPPFAVLVGPEGGFSDEERALFTKRSVRVSLGPRVLRADTAAVALLALVEAAHPSVSYHAIAPGHADA